MGRTTNFRFLLLNVIFYLFLGVDQIGISCVIPDRPSCGSSHSLHLREGDRLQIRCVYSDESRLSTPVVWKKNGRIITVNECPAQINVECSIRGHSLVVYKTKQSDKGSYTCETTDSQSKAVAVQIGV